MPYPGWISGRVGHPRWESCVNYDMPHGPALELIPVYQRKGAPSVLLALHAGPLRWTDLAAAVREGTREHLPDSTLNRVFRHLEDDLGLIVSSPQYDLTPNGRRLAAKLVSLMDADEFHSET